MQDCLRRVGTLRPLLLADSLMHVVIFSDASSDFGHIMATCTSILGCRFEHLLLLPFKH